MGRVIKTAKLGGYNQSTSKGIDGQGSNTHGSNSMATMAQVQASRLRYQGRVDGLEEGKAEAVAVLLHAQTQAQQLIDQSHKHIETLAIHVAQRLLNKEISLDQNIVSSMVKEVIASHAHRGAMVIYVNPLDVDTVLRAKPELMTLLEKPTQMSVKEDASIERGGCVVESSLGRIDARLQTQLAAIERVLSQDNATHDTEDSCS